MRMRFLIAAFALLAACGGEDDEAAPSGGGPTAPAAPVAAARPAGPQLAPKLRIEDRVACPTPTDAKKCDPNAAVCGEGQYCLSAGAAHYCGVCPERDAIRHTFKPRDFQGTDIRDPFQSFVINQPGLGVAGTDMPTDRTPRCTRRDQMVASNYSYQSLKLVGIVSQGTQRKVLMMDSGNLGHIVKKGDCVGKEKALVKDIGAGYVTFIVDKGDPVGATPREPEEQSMQLYPTQVSVNMQIDEPATRPTAPIVAPPSQGGTQQQPQQPPPGPTIRIEDTPAPPPAPVQPPPQAPAQIRP